MDSVQDSRTLRLLVAIASYGDGHLDYLNQIISAYKRMSIHVDVVVLSEAPKDLGSIAELIVGLPSKNPWTLPFAHKKVFAQRLDQYDLFVYSEDDIWATEENIRAFLKATPELEPKEIAGFMRYEVDGAGGRVLAEPWGHYHWKPGSVRRRGTYTVAEFTNEHAGFYILTQSQLKRAIGSGGFLRGPTRGRYNWPETAATDPYTNCGFRKVICISALEDFLVHHMPNRYLNDLPVSLAAFQEQIQALMAIRDGRRPASTFCEVESKRWPTRWQKQYYDQPSAELLAQVPRDAKTILSIGCGWGKTEAKLKQFGAEVTAIPLDSVIGAGLARRGIEAVYGTRDECLRGLNGRRFDCVVMSNLLHLQQEPGQLLEKCFGLVREGGALVLSGHNFSRVPWLVRRVAGIGEFRKLRSYEFGGITVCGPKTLAKPIRSAGFQIAAVQWVDHSLNQRYLPVKRIPLGSLTARTWVLQARRLPVRSSEASRAVKTSQHERGSVHDLIRGSSRR
jgi:2-polyprenyl-3-methyl-5-hydroxy-6-metoxy-1,4-benzoquinol methylase